MPASLARRAARSSTRSSLRHGAPASRPTATGRLRRRKVARIVRGPAPPTPAAQPPPGGRRPKSLPLGRHRRQAFKERPRLERLPIDAEPTRAVQERADRRERARRAVELGATKAQARQHARSEGRPSGEPRGSRAGKN